MKAKITVNNKLRDSKGTLFGQADLNTGKIEINVKRHKRRKKKLDKWGKRQLASTVKHELYHLKHPNAKEKTVYKRTKGRSILEKEQKKLLSILERRKVGNIKTIKL